MSQDSVPRLRMFAGPNGSGKTTVKRNLARPDAWFGIYVNPDDLEADVRRDGCVRLDRFGFAATTDEVRDHFTRSTLLASRGLSGRTDRLVCRGNLVDFGGIAFDSYHASVLSDFLRRKALAERRSFSFETVMSSRDKVDLLKAARTAGYRTYLYFIATEDPAINVQRVRIRVAAGGHDVPEDKVVERYHRSLALLRDAIKRTDRAFLFDTSQDASWYFAEVTDGTSIGLKSDGRMPNWFVPTWNGLRAA